MIESFVRAAGELGIVSYRPDELNLMDRSSFFDILVKTMTFIKPEAYIPDLQTEEKQIDFTNSFSQVCSGNVDYTL